MSTIDIEQVYKAWQAVGADIAGLKWEDFAKHLPEQPSGEATLAQQEPDAFVPREAIRTLSGGANHVFATLALNDDNGKAVAVFLSPQPAQVAEPRKRTWVGLTQEEFIDFASTFEYGTGGLIRAIEAKLKAKNFA